MIPLLVPEISPCEGFCDEDEEDGEEEELGIPVVGLFKEEKHKTTNFEVDIIVTPGHHLSALRGK